MDLSPIGEAVLIAREGRRLKAYRDSVGVWTIGIGHTSAAGAPAVTSGLTITSAQCDAIFARDVQVYVAAVRKGLKVPVGQHTFDALVSFCYNIGPGAFRGSTCMKRIRAGDLEGAKAAMMLWRKPAVITTRRQAEADQLVTPYSVRLPSAVAGRAPIKAPIKAPIAAAPPSGPIVPVVQPPVIAAPPMRQPDLSMPAWFLAFAAWIDAVFGPKPKLAKF